MKLNGCESGEDLEVVVLGKGMIRIYCVEVFPLKRSILRGTK